MSSYNISYFGLLKKARFTGFGDHPVRGWRLLIPLQDVVQVIIRYFNLRSRKHRHYDIVTTKPHQICQSRLKYFKIFVLNGT